MTSATRPPSWMLIRLGLETQQHHAVADADRIALMEAPSPLAYRANLAHIFGFEAPIETALAHVLDATVLRDRVKAHWLRRDLAALGLSPSEIECLPHHPVRFTSVAQALGWLFVIERHALLSGLIRRELEHRLGGAIGDATSYLAAYGDAPGARFRSLCAALDIYAAQHASYPTLIVAAASEAFRAQRQWYLATNRERETESPRLVFPAIDPA